jgi:hypothetical protein
MSAVTCGWSDLCDLDRFVEAKGCCACHPLGRIDFDGVRRRL